MLTYSRLCGQDNVEVKLLEELGINLVAGSHLIECEPWWNGNEERQVYF